MPLWSARRCPNSPDWRPERALLDGAPNSKDDRKHEQWNDGPPLQPTMKAVALKVRYVRREYGIAHRIALQQPASMSPPPAVAGRMRIAVLVGILMMDAMGCDPKERAALQCERGTDCQGVFQPLGCHISAMGKQAVVSHADAP